VLGSYLKRLNGVSEKFKSDKLPLTYIVATCPLITGLISAEKVEYKWPFIMNNTYDQNRFIDQANWDKLKTVSIAGKKDGAVTDRHSQKEDVKKPRNRNTTPKGNTSKTSALPTEPS
jgi:hypothetical protein